jgi:hypothetical protein
MSAPSASDQVKVNNQPPWNNVLESLIAGEAPCYCLPFSMIEHLANCNRIPYFSEFVGDECDFTLRVTQLPYQIGIYHNQFISSRLFNTDRYRARMGQAPRSSFEGGFRRLADPVNDTWLNYAALSPAEEIFEQERERTCAIAAAMLLDNEFRQEHDKLWSRWHSLPKWFTTPFILRPDPRRLLSQLENISCSGESQAMATDEEAQAINQWNEDFLSFLNKYAIDELAFWGLPQPSGTLMMPASLGDNAALRGTYPVTYTHPLFPLTPRDERIVAMERLQIDMLRNSPLARFRRAAAHPKKYSQFFQIMHFDAVIQQRLAGFKLPRGHRAQLSEVIGAYLHVDDSRVNALRSEMNAFNFEEDDNY